MRLATGQPGARHRHGPLEGLPVTRKTGLAGTRVAARARSAYGGSLPARSLGGTRGLMCLAPGAVLPASRPAFASVHSGGQDTPMRPARQADPFTVLGLPPRAGLSDDEVRAAWRRIAAASHSGRADGGDAAASPRRPPPTLPCGRTLAAPRPTWPVPRDRAAAGARARAGGCQPLAGPGAAGGRPPMGRDGVGGRPPV
jgi:hypothetical protein